MNETKWSPNSGAYAPVQSDESDYESLVEKRSSERLSLQRLVWCTGLFYLPWLLTVVFAVLSFQLFVQLHQLRPQQPGVNDMGFDTDFLFPSGIPLERVRFRGTPHFNSNGTPWIEDPDPAASWPETVAYTGEPSAQLDANWQRLIGKRYFSITAEEAERAWGARRHEYVDQNMGGYTAGFDMFHTLHCLNEVRKALHPNYYSSKDHPPAHESFHNDHCIEILRQTVQCYGSTTLVPTRYIDGIEHNYIDSDQMHTCRSFNYLRNYSVSRAGGGVAAVSRDQALVDEEKHALAKAWGSKYGDNEKAGVAKE